MREGPDVAGRAQPAHGIEVEPGRREQEIRVELAVAHEPPHEREAVRVEPRGRQPEDDVSVRHTRAVDERVARDQADAGPGEVELLVAIDARHLGGLAPEQRASGRAADVGRALDELRDLLEVEPVRRDVVEEEERVGAGRQDVVHAVRGEVAPRVAEPPRASREDELRPDPVRRGR